VRYADEHGRIHREKAGSKSLALRLYTRRKAEVAERRFFPERFRCRDVLLADFIRDYSFRKGGGLVDGQDARIVRKKGKYPLRAAYRPTLLADVDWAAATFSATHKPVALCADHPREGSPSPTIGPPAGRSSAPVPVIWSPRTLDAGGRRSP
jgi:hypothetical protein